MVDPNTLRIISVIAFVVLFLIGLKRPAYAIGAYMILVYCKLSSYYDFFASTKSELVFAIVILLRLMITPQFFKNISPKKNSTNLPLAIFVFCIALSFAIAMDQKYSWDYAVYHFIKVLILYFMLIAGLNSVKDIKIFIIIFLIMMAYLAYEPFYYYYTGTGGSEYQYGTNYIAQIGILSGHVALANNMNQMIPIAYFLFLSSKSKIFKIITGACLAIFIIALIGSGSRGGALGFLFLLFVIFLLNSKQNRKTTYIGLIVAVVFVVFSSTFIGTITRVSSGSATGRLLGLSHGIGMLRKGHLIGVGPGCYLIARGKYFHYTMESHNIYGQMIGDLGIPGTVAWFFFIRRVVLNLLPILRKEISQSNNKSFMFYLSAGLLASISVRLFISMASHGLYYFYWYVIAALSSRMYYIYNHNKNL